MIELPISKWLETLEEPYRTQALQNFEASGLDDDLCENSLEALYAAFEWYKTPEGARYWNDFMDVLENNS